MALSDLEPELKRIEAAIPANEAEVETKVLLHVFRLLGFTDIDRADKPTVAMNFGRERKLKTPDFLLYDGAERSLTNALVTVEAKDRSVDLEDAADQAKSYATWAGTPFYVVCNGKQLRAVQFVPAAEGHRQLDVEIGALRDAWPKIESFLSKSQAILAKERLTYSSLYLPNIEQLPPHEFFQEYLNRVIQRFASTPLAPLQALVPPAEGQTILPQIPVPIRLLTETDINLAESALLDTLATRQTRVLITAAPGSGKSTICRRLAVTAAHTALVEGRDAIPVYVRLSSTIPTTAMGAFSHACGELGIRALKALFSLALAKTHLILILGGLDEAEPSDVNRSKVAQLLRDCGRHAVLLTTRPVGVVQFEMALPFQDFTLAEIRALTDGELLGVFRSYLGSNAAADTLLGAVPPELHEDLRSPLFALMAIRVAQVVPDWRSLSKYGLFTKYVTVLDDYYNAVTVRGRSGGDTDAVAALATTAAFLSSQLDPSTWSLTELAAYMSARGQQYVTETLLNIGLLSAGGGPLRFAHQSFYDFGLAHFGVTAIRAGDRELFTSARYTMAAYELLRSQLSEQDEEKLLAWFQMADSNPLRRRILSIWRFGCAPSALNAVRQFLLHGTSNRLRSIGLRVLASMSPTVIFDDYSHLIEGEEHSRHAKVLAGAMVLSRRVEYRESLRKMAMKKENAAYACGLVQFVLENELTDALEDIVQVFATKGRKGRLEMARTIDRFRETALTVPLVNVLGSLETDPAVALMLLYAARDVLAKLDTHTLVFAANRIAQLNDLEPHQQRALRRVLRRVRPLRKDSKQKYTELATACIRVLEPVMNLRTVALLSRA